MKRTAVSLVVILISVSALAQSKSPKAAVSSTASANVYPTNVYPIQEGYVDANGVLIYYQTIGHGAPLMIVHGGPGVAHDYLMPYLLPLARGNSSSSLTNAVRADQKSWKTPRSTPWKIWWRTWRASDRRCIWARSA
jgi:hypothetical protein